MTKLSSSSKVINSKFYTCATNSHLIIPVRVMQCPILENQWSELDFIVALVIGYQSMINSDDTWAFLGPNIILMMNSRKEIRGVHRKNIGILIIPTCHPGEGKIILWKYSIKLYKCKFHSNKSMSLLGFWIRSYVDIDSPPNSPSLLWSLFLSSSPEVYCYAV